MGDDPEQESHQEAIVLNDAPASEQSAATGVEHAGSVARPEHVELQSVPEDALAQDKPAARTEPPKDLLVNTGSMPNQHHADGTDEPDGQHHAEATDEAGLEGSTLSTPIETPSAGSEHASASASTFPGGPVHPGPPKKFVSSANINKKFLQKTATPTPPPAPGKGVLPTIARPASVTPSQSQSRLVTTKLTMVAPTVPTPSAGWKSNTPSGAPSPQPPAAPSPSQAHAMAASGAAGFGATVPTTLQSASAKLSTTLSTMPRPGGSNAPLSLFAGGPPPSASRPPAIVQMQKPAASHPSVWGHPSATGALGGKGGLGVDTEFPTAAEAARGTRPRPGPPHKAEPHPPPLPADTSADAFRGIHLDPNAHHWDEIEDEEDDFLAGEVEFGDGRQYKVEVPEATEMDEVPATAIPVPREERFVDDFDRSWPRTAPLPPPHEMPRVPPQVSPTASSPRALFNERSNRLEPWGRPAPQFPSRRRESFDEHHGGFGGRDAPPHTNMHVLQNQPRSGGYPPREPQPYPTHSARAPGPPAGMVRQLPPHLSQAPHIHEHPPAIREPAPPAVGAGRPQHAVTSPESAHIPHSLPVPPPPHLATSISTAPDSASLKSLSPDAASSPALPMSAVDVGELHKMAMHSAAERAKRRRQEEEVERERERERARRKAQELEERIKAAELEKEKEAERLREVARVEQERKAAEEKQKALERRGPWQHEGPATFAPDSGVNARLPQHAVPRPGPQQANKPPELPSMRADSWRSAKPLTPIGTTHAGAHVPTALPSISPATPTSALPQKPRSPLVSTLSDVLTLSSAEAVEEVDFTEMGRLTNGTDEYHSGDHSHPRARATRAPSVNQRSDTGPWRRETSSSTATTGTTSTTGPAPTINGTIHPVSTEPESFSTLPSEVFVLHDEPAPDEESLVPRVSVPSPSRNSLHAPMQHSMHPHGKGYREPTMSISALDDAMSRIKGALGAMQEARGNLPNGKITTEPSVASATPVPARPPVPVVIRPLETTTHIDRPVSPPLAWRAFAVKVPRKSIKHDAVDPSRLHDFLQPPLPASMDILCWIPPVKDMSVRTLSRDDLFHRKTYTRGVVNARVLLPTKQFVPYKKPPPQPIVRLPASLPASVPPALPQELPLVASSLPRVLLPKSRLPSMAPRDVPPEARQHFVDSLSRTTSFAGLDGFMGGDLKLTSRSPPPEVPYPLSPPLDESASTRLPTDKAPAAPRIPRKMPDGVNLVLYKSPSRTDVTGGDASSVRFTVSSELDSQPTMEKVVPRIPTVSPGRPGLDVADHNEKRARGYDLGSDSLVHMMVDGGASTKSSEDSMSSLISTVGPPATSSASMPSPEVDSFKLGKPSAKTPSGTPAAGSTPNPWGKAILPDPDHLKAVWSHPGTSKITENSLKGLADDFPASLPVSVQELRSEDEEMPSVKNADELPTPAVAEPPTRPSFFDPHKSFQQVPAQPTSSSSRFVPPPPVNYNAANVHSHSPYAGLPTASSLRPGTGPHSGVRPQFPTYTPIVPGHSPSPPIMYSTTSPYTMVTQGVGQTISPNMPQRLWVPQQGSPAASYVTTSTQYTPGMMPYGTPGTVGAVGRAYQPIAPGSKAPGGERPMMMHNPSMGHANNIGTHVSPPYHVAGIDQIPGFSPPVHNAIPQTHVGFPPQQANPSQQMYSVPVGGGRGGAVRNSYDGYQPVPSGAFVRPSGW